MEKNYEFYTMINFFKKNKKDIFLGILFYLGIVILIVGFLLDKAEHSPTIRGVVAKECNNASIGLENLKLYEKLEINDMGFKEIKSATKLFLEKFNTEKLDIIKNLNITKFELGHGYQRFENHKVENDTEIIIYINNKERLKDPWKLSSLVQEVENYCNKYYFRYSWVIFIIGLLLSIISFSLENKDFGKQKKVRNNHF